MRLKQKYVTASPVPKRLNFYSQHPLYLALRELGRAVRTKFQSLQTEHQALADAIARVLPVNWQHINSQGGFYFSDESLADVLHFDLGALLTVEWEDAENKPAVSPSATFVPNF